MKFYNYIYSILLVFSVQVSIQSVSRNSETEDVVCDFHESCDQWCNPYGFFGFDPDCDYRAEKEVESNE